MTTKDFIKRLYDKEIPLSLLLPEAKKIAEENNEKEIALYIDKEINGYNKTKEKVPNYRIIKGDFIGDVKDIYGKIVKKNVPLYIGIPSEIIIEGIASEADFDLNDRHIDFGIPYIETILITFKFDKVVTTSVSEKMFSILDQMFHSANPDLHLQTVYQNLHKLSLEYIVARVRQNLIEAFHKIERKESDKDSVYVDCPKSVDNTKEGFTKMNKPSIINLAKKIFVTYAWGSEDFNSLVVSFVNFLRENGFDASMDKKRSQEETSVNFNQMMIEGIKNSDKVIVVLTEEYKNRADNFIGGVGTEFKMILEDKKINKYKYIFVSFGNAKREDVTPIGILGTDILDLKEDQDKYEYNNLFSKIKEENIIEFSDVSESVVEIKKVTIKPFKL